MTRLTRFIQNIINSILDFWRGVTWGSGANEKFIGTAIRDWTIGGLALLVQKVLEGWEQDYRKLVTNLLTKAEQTGEIPPELQPLVDEIKSPTSQVGAFLGQSVSGAATGGIVSSTIGPWLLMLQYAIQRIVEQQRFDPMTALAARFRAPDTWANQWTRAGHTSRPVKDDLADQGWSDARSELLFDIAHMRLVEDLLVVLRARQVFDPINQANNDQIYRDRMYLLGYGPGEADDYYKAKEYFPSPSDLVRYAVREVYSPDIVAKYGQMQDLPAKFLEEAAKGHMTEEQATNEWAAHWDLPSVTQGFEMMHRGVISEDELKLLLRTSDVMPYWRDRLVQISYNPLTRVDVRRMHKLGILDREGVKKAYRDVGYNDTNAELMTQFTIQYNQGTTTSGDRDLTKTDILRLYADRIITEVEARDFLTDLDYEPAEITYLLDLYTKETAIKTRDLTLTQVKNLYQMGLRNKTEVTQFLTKFGYDSDEILALYDLWDWQKPERLARPTRAQLDSFLIYQVITWDTWVGEYRGLGYDDRYIGWYFDLLYATGKVE
jgi:hypothetical protein